jgi:hypothetical protein
MSKTIECVTIEFVHENYWFCQHGVYGEDSVLAGEDFRQLVQAYDTLEAAVLAHPEAEVLEYEWVPAPVFMPDVAPDWFDPLDAGEEW